LVIDYFEMIDDAPVPVTNSASTQARLAETQLADQLLAINDSLDTLATEHKAEAELVKLRYSWA
jgi:hypothetical protein